MQAGSISVAVRSLAAAALLIACAGNGIAGGWYSDFEKAKEAAGRNDRPMMVHFYAEWCVPCKKMDREVFAAPQFLSAVGEYVIAVKIDVDHDREIARQFGVESVPTDLFVTPDGRILGEMNGVRTGEDYLRRVAAVHTQYQRVQALNFARSGGKIPLAAVNDEVKGPRFPTLDAPEIDGANTPAAKLTSPTLVVKPRADGTVLLGLQGHSPIALFESRKWVKGSRQFAWEHQGLTYFMATPGELDQFRQNAEKYAPRLLGCDPVLYFDEDRAVPGSTQFAAYFEESLYLFVNASNRTKFRENPQDYARRRTVLLIDELETVLR